MTVARVLCLTVARYKSVVLQFLMSTWRSKNDNFDIEVFCILV